MYSIRFWWAGYTPCDALTSFDPIVQELPFEVKDGNGRWRPRKNGASLRSVHEWMLDNDKSIRKVDLVDQRRAGRQWEGRYVLTIG